MRCLFLSALLLASSPALALELTLGRPGNAEVFVWKDAAAYSEAIRLVKAGVHKSSPDLLEALLACAPKTGAKAIATETTIGSRTIRVIDGPEIGCTGVVAIEDARSD